MSFRQYGGLNYAARHNIVASNYNTINNLYATGTATLNGVTGPTGSTGMTGSQGGSQGQGGTGYTGPTGPSGNTSWTEINNNIYNNNSGYVGIGTSTPTYDLDVNGIVGLGNRLEGTGVLPDYFWTGLRGTAGDAKQVAIGIGGDNTGAVSIINFSVNDNYMMNIQESGIAIKKQTASYDLDVNGNINFSGNLYKNGNLFVSYTGYTGYTGFTGPQGYTGPVGPPGTSAITGATGYTGYTGATGPMGNSSWTEINNIIYNNNSGYVGIGTTTPAYTLDVNGTIGLSNRLEGIGSTSDPFWIGLKGNAGDPNQVAIGIGGSTNGNVSEILFNTNALQRMAIKNSGIGINNSNPAYNLDVSGNINFSGNLYKNGNIYGLTGSSGNSSWTVSGNNIYNNNSGNVGINTSTPAYNLDVSGNANVSQTMTANSFNSSSDYRIKKNVIPLIDTQFTVDKLRPVTYINLNNDTQDIGLIAHELQEQYPFLVTGIKDGNDLQSVNYIGLIGLLIKEIQNLKNELNDVKDIIKQLKDL